MVVYTCNPSYSGDRDQEDRIQNHPEQIVHETLSRKNSSQEKKGGRVGGVTQGGIPEFKLHYSKKQNKTKQKLNAYHSP
jgi:hypothetical protein